jgi:hypothetical protein
MMRAVVAVLGLAGAVVIGSAGVDARGAAREQAPGYLDNRSSPAAVLDSYVNAINRREYARAYSYWDPDAAAQQLPPFADFVAGYSTTDSVRLVIGVVSGDAGAGQFYFSAPAILASRMADGERQTFAGCYTMHLSNPGIQSEPPFRPLAIVRADVAQVANDADGSSLLDQVCADSGGHVPPPLAPPSDGGAYDLSSSHYVDDRSGPVQVLGSYVNAVNRREYARAYSYWQAGATDLPAFPDFAQGFTGTNFTALATGQPTMDVGAGQIRYRLPAVLSVMMDDGSWQKFAGCYTLHLANPGIQVDPPFHPLAIESASVQQVAPDTDTSDLLAAACDQAG